MKFTFEQHPRLVIALTLTLAAACLYFGGFTFYNTASTPTDENVFMTPPSPVFIARDLPARFVEETGLRLFDRATPEHPDALLDGDAVITVNKAQVNSAKDIRSLLSSMQPTDSLEFFVLRSSINRHFIYRIQKADLSSDAFREYWNVVIVTSVLPGGASDRAGMKAGDIIFRINEQSFTEAQAADRILRQGQVDKSLRYDVYRGGQSLTLHVTLAKFGVPIVVLMFFLTGLVYIGTGLFIALKRPRLIAARLLGWAFIMVGGLFLIIAVGRQSDTVFFQIVRNVMTYTGIFGGCTLFALSDLYFPKEKTVLLENKWHHRVIIIMGLVLAAVAVILRSQLSILAALVPLLYIAALHVLYRKKIAAEQRSMMRGVTWSMLFIVAVNVIYSTVRSSMDQVGSALNNLNILTFILLPLAYLFTIGRYQLLETKLRIRRNLQYSALTVVWNTGLTLMLIVTFFSLPNVALPLQNVEFTGASILITDTPVSKDDFSRNEKIGAMLLGLTAVFAYVVVRRRGQRFIDEKYYQTQFDYRRALSELSEALAAKLGMNDLAHGLVSTLADLMKVKDASVLFFRGEGDCCCIESVGLATPEVSTVCIARQEELRNVLGTINGASRVEYLPLSLRKELTDLGVRIIQPICSKDRLIGAIMIGEKLSETAFKDDDISFLTSAATQASVSIENAFLYEELAEKERMKHELEIARQIQLASLPQQLPLIAGLDIAGGSLPAMEVGGDFYDYLQSNSNSLTVIIGDVSGKGTSAALYMSKVQGILRSLFTFGLSPRELFVRANKLLCKDLEKRSFVTALGAEFNLNAKMVQIARAGHLPLYCFNADLGVVEKIVSPGIGLGLNDAEQPFALLEEYRRPLKKGDLYVFVSDGITEAQNEQGDDYGEQRLIAFIAQHRSESSLRIRDLLLEEVKCFTAGAPQHDDQTIVCISVRD
jgi:serine phosphatase RsbU (regulator of sigma subunit)